MADQHRTIGLHLLTDDFQTEFIKSAERGQIGCSEGSVEHVEVFRMASVRTSIIGRPRPLSPDRRAHPAHTPTTPSIAMSRITGSADTKA